MFTGTFGAALLLCCVSVIILKVPAQDNSLPYNQDKSPLPLSITEVHWIDPPTVGIILQVCLEPALPDRNATLTVTRVDSDPVVVHAGPDSDDSDKCSEFPMDQKFVLPESLTMYKILFTNSFEEVTGGDNTTFAMTAKATLLPCGTSPVTKLTWADTAPVTNHDCMGGSAAQGDVCYLNDNFSNRELCFSIQDTDDVTVKICLNGTLFPAPSAANDVLSANKLIYSDTADGPSKLSLSFGNQSLENFRVILRPGPALLRSPGLDNASVHACMGGVCVFEGYAPGYATYDLCAETLDSNDDTEQTATTVFTDLNILPYHGDGAGSSLLEFVFSNGLPGKNYTANLFEFVSTDFGDIPIVSVSVDCSAVEEGRACFGFLDTGTLQKSVYLALANATDGANKIFVPYNASTIE